uniref:Transmembrane protein 213 n=1 Tax=Rousettus aegyptiacus TaxID=9407 RepID=A0A7J8D981_ROUAE|nr:transmembrane protein 213 [Rousettus aegyptiacus]
MKRLASVPRAALVLSLVLGSLHSACLAEASSGSNSTLTAHHPDPETLEQCLTGAEPRRRLSSDGHPLCWFPLGLASTGSGYLANLQGEADQLWKFCMVVCFWDSRRSSSRMALMSEAEEWPGWRSSVELVA